MDERAFKYFYMMLYAAARAVHGAREVFGESGEGLTIKHPEDAREWIQCSYETVAGIMEMVDLVLDELTARLLDDDMELILKEK